MNPILPISPSSTLVTSEAAFALCFVLLLLAPLVIAGIALINVGLGRSRSAAQALLGSLAIVAVAAIVFAVVGAAWAGSAGMASHTLQLAGKPWNWLGAGRCCWVVSAPPRSSRSSRSSLSFWL